MRFEGYGIKRGFGNGYVAIPEGHPCYQMDYDDIEDKYDIDVHGGLTFAGTFDESIIIPKEAEGKWIVGFDTAHYNDSLSRWPDEESVMIEALKLQEQLEKISATMHFTIE